MLAIRFIISFVLGLLFVLHALKNTFAYAHQGRQELLVTRKYAREEKEDLNCIVTARTKLIGLGRGKMVEYKVLRNGNEARKERNGRTSEISGANSDGNCCLFEGKKDFNVKSTSIGDRRNRNLKGGAGFLAFSADYHGPKRHPPRHN